MLNNKNLGLIISILCLSIASYSQGWEAMDKGIEYLNSGGISDVHVSPIDGKVYATGYWLRDGHGEEVGTVIRWDENLEKWITLVDSRHPGNVMESFQNKLYISGDYLNPPELLDRNYLHIFQNGELTLVSDAPTMPIFNMIAFEEQMLLMGYWDNNIEDQTSGIFSINGQSIQTYFDPNMGPSIRIDDAVQWRGDTYVIGKDLHSSFSGADGFAQLADDQFMAVHNDFTDNGNFFFVYSAEVFQDNIYIGGTFHHGTGHTGMGIQYFDGTEMHELDGGVNRTVYDMKVYKGELYVAGSFFHIGEGIVFAQKDSGEKCHGIAKWDGEEWTCLFDGEFPLSPYPFSINSLDIYNDTLYIAGNWTMMDGDIDKSCIARRRIYPKPGITDLDGFSLFPNPSEGSLTLDFGKLTGIDAQCVFHNTIGQKVSAITIPAWTDKFQIDTSNLAQGVYIVRVQLGDAIKIERILVN